MKNDRTSTSTRDQRGRRIMGRRTFLSALGLGAAALRLGRARATEHPNIVLMIADDMNWDDCGVYGHQTIRTPNIDRLASEGMRFTNAFVTTSSCSPSRASMLTGLYPHNTDAEQLHWPVPSEKRTFVEQLRGAGYWCAAAGKWHLGDALRERFDYVYESDPSGFVLPTADQDGQPAMVAQNEASGCEKWLDTLRMRPRERPFFLWLAALDPHRDYEEGILAEPHRPEDVRVPPYLPDVPEVRKELALYYDECARLDGYVGQILDELDAQGVADSTIVLFLSDNGRPFPRDKTTLYDGGIKTPFIVRWPGRTKPGSVCAELVSTIDLAPTCLGLAGLPVPEAFAGVDFAPLLEAPETPVRGYVFAEHHWHDYAALEVAVRSKRYKLIRNYYSDLPLSPPADVGRSPTFTAMRRLREADDLTPAQEECFIAPRPREVFYDTETDPYELQNRIGDTALAGAVAEHRAALDAWVRETGFQVPPVRTPDEFDRETGQPLPNRVRPRPSKADFAEMLGLE